MGRLLLPVLSLAAAEKQRKRRRIIEFVLYVYMVFFFFIIFFFLKALNALNSTVLDELDKTLDAVNLEEVRCLI